MDKTILFKDISSRWINRYLDSNELNYVIDELNEVKGEITPNTENIFEFAKYTSSKNIKVIILGQDPYPTKGNAHGLAFSALKNVPRSLLNIYKCLKNHNLIDDIPDYGCLRNWAKQGVILLNCALTTVVGETKAHINIWETYINNLIVKLSNSTIECKKTNKTFHPIFLLWGGFAKNKKSLINPNCTILTYAHPSPLQRKYNFNDCDHFVQVNNILSEYNIKQIDWNVHYVSKDVISRFGGLKSKNIIFTDGSCYPNKSCAESKAGYATYIALGIYEDIVLYGSIDNKTCYATNIRAEGMAIVKALEYLNDRINDVWDIVIIVTDCEFWIKMIEMYMPSWAGNDDSFAEKKNPDITVKMWKLYCNLKNNGVYVEFRHVRSHNKSGWLDKKKHTYEYYCAQGNSYVDQYANWARENLEPNTHLIDRV